MSSTVADENERALYLKQLDIDTASKTKFRVKLFIDEISIDMERNGKSLMWIPTYKPEISSTSLVLVVIKAGYTLAGVSVGRLEERIDISGDEVTRIFWESESSEVSIARQLTFDGQPMTISLHFHPSPTSQMTRTALHKLRVAIKDFKPLMANSIQHVDKIMKVGTAVSEINPYSKAAFSIATVTVELLKEQQKYDSMVSDLAGTIERILPFKIQVEETLSIDSEPPGPLQAVLEKLGTLILDAAEFVCTYVHRGALKRTFNSTEDHRKIKSLSEDLQILIEDFSRAVGTETYTSTKKMLSLQEIRFLESRLHPIPAGYDADKCCMPDTRRAVLDSIISWALQPLGNNTTSSPNNDPKMFWLFGIPGLGKTSVASSLCAQLKEKERLGGSFFCRRDDPLLGEPKYALPTLIYGLAAMWRPYRKLLVEKLKKDSQLNPASMGDLLLSRLLKQLRELPSHPLVVVIDALDECGGPNARKSILSALSEASLQFSRLKVIVTSRQEQDIERFFENLENRSHYQSRDLGMDEGAQADITLFARRRFAMLASSSSHLPDDWPGKEILEAVVTRAQGLFIYVETVWRLVSDEDELNPTRALMNTIHGTSGDALADLYKLYSNTIEIRIGKSKGEFRAAIGVIIVVASYRPLCDKAIATLAGLETLVVQTLVDKLSSLLYRDKTGDGSVRVRHISLADFLTGSICPPEFRVDIERTSLDVGLACLDAMINELKFNICELETSLLFNNRIRDLAGRVRTKISDALQYSCLYWTNHLCSVPYARASPRITKRLSEFLEGARPLYWMEVLSVMGKVALGIEALRQLLSWAKSSKDQYIELIKDVLRFLVTFNTPITMSVPHIYLSALPFTPVESHMWKASSALFKENLIKVSQGRMKSWPSNPATWTGHTGSIKSITYSPDGRYIVSGSDDKTLRKWDAETGQAVGEPWIGHTNSVYSVAYSPDGRYVVSGSHDKTIRMWDAETGQIVGEPWEGHTGMVFCIAYSPDGRYVVSGSSDKTIRMWDAENGQAVGEPWRGHERWIFSLAYSPNGRYIVSGCLDNTIRIWDTETGQAVGEPWKGHEGRVRSLAYSPDGRYIVSGFYKNTVKMWDAETGHAIGEPWEGHTDWVDSIAYSPDGRYVVSGSYDNTIRMWDAETGQAAGEPWRGHSSGVTSLAYSPDGRYVVSGCDDKMVRMWDAETGQAIGEPWIGHTRPVESVAYSPDGRYIISGSCDNMVRMWDVETGQAVGEPWIGHTKLVMSVTYSPDGLYVVSGSDDNTIRIWDAKTGQAVGEPWRGHTGRINSLAYSPNGHYVISGSWDNMVRMWDVRTGQAVGEPWIGHTEPVESVTYSPDGLHVVSGSWDKTIRMWDAKTGQAVGEPWRGHKSLILSLAYSPNGHYIVSGSSDSTVRMWDVETGQAVGEPWIGHTNSVHSVAYSPDGRYVVSGSRDNTIRMWDAETGRAVGDSWEGHTAWVNCVAYSPDGRFVISSADDTTIRIWDTYSQNHQHKLTLLPPELHSFPLSSDIDHLPDSQGWIHHPEGGLLYWVPEGYRSSLICPAVMIIPTHGRQRPVRLDFTNFRYGTSWSDVYEAKE